MEQLMVEAAAKWLHDVYFKTWIDDGCLDIGTITPADCEYIVQKINEIENKVAVKEFAL